MSPPEEPAQREDAGPAPRQSRNRFELLVDSVQDYAIFMLDVQGRVMSWNAGAQRIKGWKADEIIGRSFETFYPPESVASGWPKEELRRATKAGRFEDQGWRVRKDGTRMWANVVITALRDDSGELRGFAKVTRDLTDARRQEEALRQSEEQLRLLVESVKDYAIFMLDPHGFIRTWNAGALAIHGCTAAEVLGKHFSIFFTPEDKEAGRPALELERALREGRADEQGWRLRKDGRLFWAEVVLTPVMDASDTLRGFAKVTRDMTEQRRLTELELSSRRMSEFLAMLAHELRNPLAPVRNAVNILEMQRDLSPQVRQMSEIIARQTRHLTRLVDDLLEVARIVTGKILLKCEPIDFRDAALAAVEAAGPQLEARRQQLTVRLPPEPVPVAGDATRLAQVLQNLLNNAARYTHEGGDVALLVRTTGKECIATVTDNGIGIPRHALTRIFELFVQEHSPRMPHDSGLGIGLTLARMLVQQHGGSLTAHSEGEGKGSEFAVRLPLRDEPAPEPVPAPRLEDNDSRPRRRVLVIDDNRDSTDTMVELIGLLGHEARGAYGLAQALDMLEQFTPQVALVDLNMPEADGYTVLRHLRELPGLDQLYAAAMTGYGQKADRQATLAAGFDAHLTKPVELEQLCEVLDAASDR